MESARGVDLFAVRVRLEAIRFSPNLSEVRTLLELSLNTDKWLDLGHDRTVPVGQRLTACLLVSLSTTNT